MLSRIYASLIVLSLVFGLSTCQDNLNDSKGGDEPILDAISADSLGILNPKEMYFQHVMLRLPANLQGDIDSVCSWIIKYQPGALQFDGWNVDNVKRVQDFVDSSDILPPFYAVNYFEFLNLPSYAFWDANSICKSAQFSTIFKESNIQLIDFSLTNKWSSNGLNWLSDWQNKDSISFISSAFNDVHFKKDYPRFIHEIENNNQGIRLTLSAFDTINLTKIRDVYHFEGLFFVKSRFEKINTLLEKGADFILFDFNSNMESSFLAWSEMEKELSAFEESTNRILKAKKRSIQSKTQTAISQKLKFVQFNFMKAGTTIIGKDFLSLPIDNPIQIHSIEKIRIDELVRLENKVSFKQIKRDSNWVSNLITNDKALHLIVLGDSIAEGTIRNLKNRNREHNVFYMIHSEWQFEELKEYQNLIFSPFNSAVLDFGIVVQQLSGRVDLDGDLCLNKEVVKGVVCKANRLSRVQPEMVGINSDTLNKIQYAVRQAINGKAFPGCQVLIAKSGSIIYDESFGYYTYNKEVAVSKNSVYDLASLTKVLATTLVGMKLYELKEIDLKDSLHKYLPDSLNDYLQYPSTIRNVTFQELFTHQSGMPSGFPILEYIQYQTKEIGRYDKYYCDIKDSIYSIEVAKNFFIEKAYQDSMWIRLNKLWLDSDKNYKYSDVNMNTLYFIFKGILNANYNNFGFKKYELEQDDFDIFEAYLNKTIYKALNLKRTFYRPITKVALDEIVPTENETYWRKQLLQGYVHDPTAALYGGVAGNAGLFSSANELVVICEMLRRRGAYNGVQILDAATVDLFTQAQPNTFRGLGFNKPSMNTSAFGCAPSASLKTYGHTGFTGTCFWVDPESEIVFIFLSNRVNPKVNNRIYEYGIRKNIHQTAYDANFIN